MSAGSLAEPRPPLAAAPIETPFFIETGGARLFAMLHAIEGGEAPLAFVMSHPFAEEKLWSHRAYVSHARALAVRGWPVLRFDYQGAGDSSGTSTESSLASHLSDLTAAVAWLRHRLPSVEKVGLIGLRFGASVAALLAEQAVADEKLACLRRAPLVLWEPVVNGDAYFQELLRTNLATQLAVHGRVQESRDVLIQRVRDGGVVNVDGYEIGRALLDSGALADLVPLTPKLHDGPALVVHIAATPEQKPRPEFQSLASSYGRGELVRVIEQPFWREIKAFYGDARSLGVATIDWLEGVQ